MKFIVTCRDRTGAKREEDIESASRAACVAECRRRGIVPIAIRESNGAKCKGGKPKRRHLGLIIGLVLLVVCSISTGLLFVIKGDKSSSGSYHEPTPEERENNTLHIKSFLGYEFGQTYPSVAILDEPWFGFTKVECNKTLPGGPLYSLTFFKKTEDNVRTIFKNSDEQQGIDEFWNLWVAIINKYDVNFSVLDANPDWNGLLAIYYGKYTEIRITQRYGTLKLEIVDIKYQEESVRHFGEEVNRASEKLDEETRQNLQRDNERKKRDAERM